MNSSEKTPRRDFVKKSVAGGIALGAGMSFTAALLQSFTSDRGTYNPEEIVFSDIPKATNEKEFRMGVIGPAELSLATSQIAVEKCTQKNAKEFAGFEKGEAIAVTGVLKDLGTPVPPMSAKATATLTKIKSLSPGAEFDKTYIKAQLENHVFLRDLAQSYLTNARGKAGAAENQTRHLATLALAVFKEHVSITSRILNELGGA